eukprot:scaffold137_cov398-Prasinococcus_capsulatus_cf.AAC.68
MEPQDRPSQPEHNRGHLVYVPTTTVCDQALVNQKLYRGHVGRAWCTCPRALRFSCGVVQPGSSEADVVSSHSAIVIPFLRRQAGCGKAPERNQSMKPLLAPGPLCGSASREAAHAAEASGAVACLATPRAVASGEHQLRRAPATRAVSDPRSPLRRLGPTGAQDGDAPRLLYGPEAIPATLQGEAPLTPSPPPPSSSGGGRARAPAPLVAMRPADVEARWLA